MIAVWRQPVTFFTAVRMMATSDPDMPMDDVVIHKGATALLSEPPKQFLLDSMEGQVDLQQTEVLSTMSVLINCGLAHSATIYKQFAKIPTEGASIQAVCFLLLDAPYDSSGSSQGHRGSQMARCGVSGRHGSLC